MPPASLGADLETRSQEGLARHPAQRADDLGSDNPELFFQNHHRRPLLLDEIQYAPEILGTLKRFVDRDRSPGQYLIIGSQQWEVMKALSESLAGRAVFVDLDGFSIAETLNAGDSDGWLSAWLDSPEDFDGRRIGRHESERSLYELLWRGSLPEADTLPLDVIPDFFNAYLRTYVDRDVRLLGDVADWHAFSRFVRLSAALTAQEINYMPWNARFPGPE